MLGANSGPGGTVSGLAIQADGKIVIAGTTLPRYLPNGSLDTSFGLGGIVNTSSVGVALQTDGRIDVAGAAMLSRYLPSQPVIGAFTASSLSVTSGDPVTLTAANITDGNPNSSITAVEFYYFDDLGIKQTLGSGVPDGIGSWMLTFNVNFGPGNYTLYAQATDNFGVTGEQIELTLTVN